MEACLRLGRHFESARIFTSNEVNIPELFLGRYRHQQGCYSQSQLGGEMATIFVIFAKLSLNSTKAELVLFSDNTATHPPNWESRKMEQDVNFFN